MTAKGQTQTVKRTWPAYEDRFWSKVDRSGECWIWTGGTNVGGYGRFRSERHDRRMVVAHRVAYEMVVGPVPDGLVLDHLCRVRACVNPAHLEPVTFTENVQRGLRAQERPICGAGLHAMSGENLLISKGKRYCKTCRNAHKRERRTAERKEAQ